MLNTEYGTDRNPVTPSTSHQVPDLFSPQIFYFLFFNLASLFFLEEFYPPRQSGDPGRGICCGGRAVGKRKIEWRSGPAKGAKGPWGLGISPATTPIFSLLHAMVCVCLWFSANAPRRPREGRGRAAFSLRENQAAARVPASRTPFGARSGPCPPRHPAGLPAPETVSAPVLGLLLAPETPSSGLT